jgi:hypothetical protein
VEEKYTITDHNLHIKKLIKAIKVNPINVITHLSKEDLTIHLKDKDSLMVDTIKVVDKVDISRVIVLINPNNNTITTTNKEANNKITLRLKLSIQVSNNSLDTLINRKKDFSMRQYFW